MDENKTKRWIDIYRQISQNLNKRKHSRLGVAPIDITLENFHEFHHKKYPKSDGSHVVCKFGVGDKVRIPIHVANSKLKSKAKRKSTFEKGYMMKWTKELYTIWKVQKSGAICYYRVTGPSGRLPRPLYERQLNLVLRKRPF